HHRDVAEAQTAAGALARRDELPDGVGDRFHLAPRVRAGEDAQAAVARPLGTRRALTGGAPPEHVALHRGEESSPALGLGVDEAAVEVALGELVEQANVLAARASPVPQREVLGVLEQAVRVFLGSGQRPRMPLQATLQLAVGLDVVPQLATG